MSLLLTPEQYEYIDSVIVRTARQQLIGRKLIPSPPPIGFGKEVIKYDVLSEMRKGKIDLKWGAGFSADIPGLTRPSLSIPVLHSEFRLNRRQMEASRTEGIPLDTTTIEAAVYAVALQEDDFIIKGFSSDGGTTYEIPGLYYGAGNDNDTENVFSTPANIPTAVNDAIKLLEEDNIYGPYNMVLNPAEFIYLWTLIEGTSEWYYNKIKERLGGEIFESPAMPPGVGLVCAVSNLTFADLAIGQDMTDETEEM
ncbi:MAG: family 1 encapsulin nanocompartment shell protein, partial [archaeon]